MSKRRPNRTANVAVQVCIALALSACGGGSGSGNPPPPPPPPPPAPTVTIAVTPRIVRSGATAQVTWTATDATSCTASNDWSGARPTTGSETVGPFTQNATLTLTCTGGGGSGVAGTSVTFRPGVNIAPTAVAGPDQTVFSTVQVQLTGSNSSDDAGIASMSWAQTSGPTVTLNDLGNGFANFVAPTVATDTVLSFALTATDDEGAVSPPDTTNVTVQPIPPAVTLSGQITYERVVFGPLGQGLNYPGIGFVSLGAEVLIEAIDATTLNVVASGRFASDYQLTVPSQLNIALRATAEMSRQAPRPLPHWQIAVRDLDVDDGTPLGAIHSYTSPAFSSGAGGVRDIRIPSGWNSSGQLVGPRFAAPFAILDSVQQGMLRVLSVTPNGDFPSLTIDWGPNNEGGIAFYTRDASGARRLVLAAEVDVDTDEYDPSVILHEFGHYIDDAFSRSDNLGGPHSFGERLDMRVAFGEGLATAFSAIANGNPYYRDSFGQRQSGDGFVSIEDDSVLNEGWYSEASAQELIWDLFDNDNDGDGDTLTLGFGPLWSIWQGPHGQTDAMTSIFSFITALKQARPADAAAIDSKLSNEQISGPALDIYGSTVTNDAGSSDVLPIYTPIAPGGSVQLRSTDAFGTPNKLSVHRLLRLNLPALTNVRFDVTAAAGRDPDIAIFRRGVSIGPAMGPADESFALSLDAGDYVLDVYDCGNAECNPSVTAAPTDITISITPN